MSVKFTNNAVTTLSAGITNSATTITVADGSVFPALGAGEHFYATILDGTNIEIIKVTARSGNTLTATRGQDNTTAAAFVAGDDIELRVTAAGLADIPADYLPLAGGLMTGNLSFGDNIRARFGAGPDLLMYHTGTYSLILEQGTGALRIAATNLELRNTSQTAFYMNAVDGGAVNLYYNGSSRLATTADGITVTNDISAAEFIGDLRGPVLFKAQAGEALAKGDVVYISGISGNTTVVSKADANDANKMPAFGLAAAAASLNAAVDIYTFGTLTNLDTSSFTIGDTLYVSTTAGALTNSPPTGESSLIQNIGKVTRSDASVGSIKIGGAGRTNATPNLNNGNVFIGNASNQAVARALVEADISDFGTYLTGNQTITLTGDVSGSGTTSIAVTVADDSHNHIISNVDGLQTALDAKAPLASPAFTGTPTAPTAATATNTTQIATTAFVKAQNYLTSLDVAGLSDVTITSIATGELLRYNGTGWANATLAEAGIAATGDIPTNNNQLTNGAGYITGNQTITLSGDVSGSGTTAITVTVADDSHNHIISNVDGLQTALDAKAPLASPALTGTPTAPTAATATNTTQIATTAFVKAQGYTTNTGTVTSVGGTGTVNGLTLSGTVTTSGNLTLGGSVSGGLTGVTSVYNTSLAVGRSSTTERIDFGTSGQIGVFLANTEEFRFAAGGTFHADADVVAFSTTVASDEKLKHNIHPISDALEKVQNLTGVTFQYRRDDKEGAGVIAQAVERVMPSAVKEVAHLKDEGTYKSVDYNQLIGLLIEAVKDQQQQIYKLQKMLGA